MARAQLEYHPEAIVEARESTEWYRAQSDTAPGAFERAIRNGLDRIANRPLLGRPYLHGTRRYVVSRFPYLIVYRRQQDRVQIIAFAHAKRRPGYWRDRLQP